MPELNFKGKEFVYNHHLTVPFRPLEIHPDKGIGEPTLDGNLIIHGDNLHALKALLPMYAGRVDCIFIDPPYNTGNEGWCYNDNVNSPMIREWLESNPIGVEDGLRHDKWACMMWPRLRLLHELLAPNGSIWITLDDNEQHRMRSICDEIFGETNFVANISWHARKSVQNDTDISTNNVNHIIVYSKLRRRENRRLKAKNADRWLSDPGFVVRPLQTDQGRYSNPDNDPRGPWKLDPFDAPGVRANLEYPITNPETGEVHYPPNGRHWGTEPDKFKALLADGRIMFGKRGTGRPGRKVFALENEAFGEVETNWWDGPATTTDGIKELSRILPDVPFDNPKPVALLQKIFDHAVGAEALILDSFAGSGTTAHAVLAANARDGGDRRFILVEGEEYADKLTAERVRRVINGYDFMGTQREELLKVPITFTKLKNANALLEKVQQIETLDGPKFDRIRSTVQDGTLIVTGERDCTETAPGLGGTFTYCTLGDPIDMDGLLTGEDLPAVEQLAALLYHTATAQAFERSQLAAASEIGEGVYRLGHANGRHLWLFYERDLNWLKSADAALTLSKARAIAASDEGEHLVFAPAKFVSRELLAAQRIPVEYSPLPYSLYRVETA